MTNNSKESKYLKLSPLINVKLKCFYKWHNFNGLNLAKVNVISTNTGGYIF
jgi:hypothetical protein